MPEEYDEINGFTLMEILIAIAIFSFIVVIIYPSFSNIAESAAYLKTDTDNYDMAMTCLSRMTEDLSSIYIKQKPEYIKPEFDADEDSFRFSGASEYIDNEEAPVMRFTSLAHLDLVNGKNEGVARIVYYCKKNDSGKFDLYRSDMLNPGEKFERKNIDPLIAKNLKSVEYTYFNAAGEERETWDSESDETGYSTPGSVEIVLVFGDEKKSFKVKTRVMLPCVREATE